MKKEAIKSPRLPGKAISDGGSLPTDQICADASYANLKVSGQNYVKQVAGHVVFTRCHFQSVNFDRVQLPSLDLSDARFDECDLANADWRKVILDRVEFVGCRLLGLRANEAHFKNTVIQECNASLAQFRFTTFKAVRFENCNLRGADFQEADLRGVVFKDCDLREVQMSSARLENTDFRGSEIEGLMVGADNLKGAIVEPFQAAYFAGLMGLQVKWTDTES